MAGAGEPHVEEPPVRSQRRGLGTPAFPRHTVGKDALLRCVLTARKTMLKEPWLCSCAYAADSTTAVQPPHAPARVLNALLDPGRDHTLGAHSSHRRKPLPPDGWQRKHQLR